LAGFSLLTGTDHCHSAAPVAGNQLKKKTITENI
jgi:hypothetical protein